MPARKLKTAPKKRGPGRPKLEGHERLVLRVPSELKTWLLVRAAKRRERPSVIAERAFKLLREREGE